MKLDKAAPLKVMFLNRVRSTKPFTLPISVLKKTKIETRNIAPRINIVGLNHPNALPCPITKLSATMATTNAIRPVQSNGLRPGRAAGRAGGPRGGGGRAAAAASGGQ